MGRVAALASRSHVIAKPQTVAVPGPLARVREHPRAQSLASCKTLVGPVSRVVDFHRGICRKVQTKGSRSASPAARSCLLRYRRPWSSRPRAARATAARADNILQRFSCEPRPPPPVFRHLSFCILVFARRRGGRPARPRRDATPSSNTWNHLTDTCCLLIHLPAAPTLLPCFANSTTPAARAYSVSSRPRPTWSPAT